MAIIRIEPVSSPVYQGKVFTAKALVKNLSYNKEFSNITLNFSTKEYVDDLDDSLFNIQNNKRVISLKPQEEQTISWEIESVALGQMVPLRLNLSYQEDWAEDFVLLQIEKFGTLPDVTVDVYAEGQTKHKDLTAFSNAYFPGDEIVLSCSIMQDLQSTTAERVMAFIEPVENQKFCYEATDFAEQIELEYHLWKEKGRNYSGGYYEKKYVLPDNIKIGKYTVLFKIDKPGYEIVTDEALLDKEFTVSPMLKMKITPDALVYNNKGQLIRLKVEIYNGKESLLSVNKENIVQLNADIVAGDKKATLLYRVENNPDEIVIDPAGLYWEGVGLPEEIPLGDWLINLKIDYCLAKTQETIRVNLADIPKSACKEIFNGYKPMENLNANELTLLNNLKEKNQIFAEYVNTQGFVLKYACDDGNTILLFLDGEKMYFDSMKYSEDTNWRAMPALIAVLESGTQFYEYNIYNMDFYNIFLDDYRFEGTGSSTCHFDKQMNNQVLYICTDDSDSGGSKIWYAYKIKDIQNIKVKEKKWALDPNMQEIKIVSEQIYDNELLQFFSEDF